MFCGLRLESLVEFPNSSSAGETYREELLSAQVGPGGLQVLREGVRLSLPQADLQRQHPQPPHGGAVLRLQGSSLRGSEYPLHCLHVCFDVGVL